MDGGGEIGGGSVYVEFHAESEGKVTSEVKLNDLTTEPRTLTITFPKSVPLNEVVKGQVITVTTDQLKPTPIKIDWREGAGQKPDPPQPPQVSATSAGQKR